MSVGKIFVVLGAKGGTGSEIVKRLVEKSESEVSQVRCIVRDPATIPEGLLPSGDDRVSIFKGDATKADSLVVPFSKADTVFFAAQGKNYDSMCMVDRDSLGVLAQVAKKQGVRRVVMISSMLVDPVNRFHFIRIILNSPILSGFYGLFHFKGLMDLKFDGENLLRQSGQEYTIVRPGALCDGPLGAAKVLVAQTNSVITGGKKSTRADVAAFCVMAAEHEKAANATVEIASDLTSKGSTTVPKGVLNGITPDN